MDFTTALFALSSMVFVGYLTRSTFAAPAMHTRAASWLLPAGLSLAFFLYSVYTIWVEGPLGFYTDHTRDFWGMQIWMDLLMGVAIAWTFMAPRARQLGMRVAFWMIFVVATGNVGLMAMLARLLWLQDRRQLA